MEPIKTGNIEPNQTANTRIANALERIANVQEQMLIIAAEAREERMKLAANMNKAMKAGFQQEK